MLIKIQTIHPNALNPLTVDGENIGIFTLYDKTHIRLPKRHWESHWYKLAHTKTGIVLLDQANFFDKTKILINNHQMAQIAKTLDAEKFPEPTLFYSLVANKCNGQIDIINYVKSVIDKVVKQGELKPYQIKREPVISHTQLSLI